MSDIFGLTIPTPPTPGDLVRYVPAPVVSPFVPGGQFHAPPIDPRYRDHLTSLTNKYRELSPFVAQLPEPVRESLIRLDAGRVARGAPPLTRRQTILAATTAATGEPQTPAPERDPLNVLGNIRGDIRDILRSIPRLPVAAFQEAMALPRIGEHMAEAQGQGMNPLAAILTAPGVRLLPGAYTFGNIMQGTTGLRELITHPVQTFLDVLPFANRAAAATRTGRLLTEAAEQAGRRPRPLTGMLTNRAVIDPATGQPTLARTRLGTLIDEARTNWRLGQTLDAAFGRTSRDIMRYRGQLEARYKALAQGFATPADEIEAFLPRIQQMFERHAKTYPQLLDESEAGAAWRAQVAEDFARGDTAKYDPSFVADYREIVDDIGREAVNRGILGEYQGEIYPLHVARQLRAREARVNTTRRLIAARNEYINPSGTLTVDQMRAMVDDLFNEPTHTGRSHVARAMMHVLDAYGIPIDNIRSALASLHRSRGNWVGVRAAFDDALAIAQQQQTLTPRRSLTEIIDILDKSGARKDPQVAILKKAVAGGRRNEVTAALKNLYSRKPPHFPDNLWPGLRDDIRSASRRMEFDMKVGKKATDKRLQAQEKALQDAIARTPPARFDALLADEMRRRIENVAIKPGMSADEAAQIVTAIQERRWQAVFPGMDPADIESYLRTVESEVKQTWQDLRAAGHDPIFVHKVSPARATSAQTGNINPIPVSPSQGKERALDLSPSVNDLQLALTHQAGELLQQMYRERFVEHVIDAAGKPEAQLRQELAPFARMRAQMDPTLDFEGHLQEIIRQRFRRFNPDEAGYSWGGVRLDKYRQDTWYLPIAVADNLQRLTKPPSMIARTLEPFTDVFRYNVIGLSPSVIVNNFLSNAVATLAEAGPGPFKYWSQAREWLRDPRLIPDERLKALILSDNPVLPTVNRNSWLKPHNFAKFVAGHNAAKVFYESAAANAIRRGKSALDGVVEKSTRLQSLGDNIYRAMIYMDEYDKLIKRGKTAEQAALGAIEQVNRVIVDYTAFTPIERQAIRTIIPFYSFMGHAMRFVMRYPLDHPVRAAIVSKLAAAEKERLGALPDEFLGYLPLPFGGGDGKKTMIPLRPFDPFGDISDMFSIAGWLGATNPLIQTALESVGVRQGQADAYPTMRYNPDTDRMEPVRPGFLPTLIENVIPRAGLLTAPLGLNEVQNELRQRDPAAANRQLLQMAGIPTLWRSIDVPREQMEAELARQQSERDVRNAALRSGDWREALRYPNLRAYFDQVLTLESAQIADLTPDDPQTIAEGLRRLIGVA